MKKKFKHALTVLVKNKNEYINDFITFILLCIVHNNVKFFSYYEKIIAVFTV